MDKIQDYVRWRGDLDFSVRPLTTEDIVVLCSLMYCPWEELQELDYRGRCLGQLNSWVYQKGKLPKNAAGWQKNLYSLWQVLPEYPRFADIRLADFMATTSDDEESQIAAAVFEIDGGERGDLAVVAFRGTDTTVSDWKESLEIGHHGLLPARNIALDYLNAALAKYERVYVCGHSKGGNLAMYSAAHADNQDRIAWIYNLDGPGLDKDSYDNNWTDIEARVTTIIPYGSTIGVMMGYGANYSVVSASVKGLGQHDTFTWEFNGPHLNYLDKMSTKSRVVGKTLHRFLESTSEDDRRLVIDTVRRLADTAETDDTNDLAKSIAKRAPKIIRHIRNIDEEDKAALKDLSKKLIEHGVQTIKNEDI